MSGSFDVNKEYCFRAMQGTFQVVGAAAARVKGGSAQAVSTLCEFGGRYAGLAANRAGQASQHTSFATNNIKTLADVDAFIKEQNLKGSPPKLGTFW